MRTEIINSERECDLTNKNSLTILASNPPKCQSPLLGLYYKNKTKGKLIMNYNEYYDEIYLEIYEEFGATAVSDVDYAKELQDKKGK